MGGGQQKAMERHCFAAAQVAGQLGLGERVQRSIAQTFERWDGKGAPAGARAEEIVITARIVNLADVMEVCHRTGGLDAAISVARQRSGTQFDPTLVDAFCSMAAELFDELDAVTTWDAVIADEPGLAVFMSDDEFDAALEAIADFADLKSPYTLEHSRIVVGRRRPRHATTGCPPTSASGFAGPVWCTILGASECRTQSGTSPAR